MSHQEKKGFMLIARSALTVVLIATGSLCLPSLACANYEQAPEHFGVSGEAEQLNGSLAIAINVDGAGGVEAGSIYVVGQNGRVLRFSPGREEEAPTFREAWGWGIGKNGGERLSEFQRCGPAYAAEPRPAGTFAVCRPASPTGFVEGIAGEPYGGEQAGSFGELGGVAVDQATGDVYVLLIASVGNREHRLIEVFSPTGQPIGGFGDQGRSSESIAEGPQNLHNQAITQSDGIAVDDTGVVYVIDKDFPGAPGVHESRVMSFEPTQPGDYEHYVYGGRAKDTVDSEDSPYKRIALFGTTRLIAAGEQTIREYATGRGSSPICKLLLTGGQIAGMTANALTGEVFYFVLGRRAVLRRLGPCDPTTHNFQQIQELTPTPQTEKLFGLAVNPRLAWSAQRPAGVLYGADAVEPRGHEGDLPDCGGTAQCGIGDIFIPAEGQDPVVTSESVLNATSTTVTLRAQIDPRGSTTSFRFQYLTKAGYDANGEKFAGPNIPGVAPVVPAQVGTGGIATVPISDLEPDTEYRFRVIVTSECLGPGEAMCEATGPTAAFATYPLIAGGLPDGRAYELVSPAQKQGGEAFPADPRISSCGECKPPGSTAIFTAFPMQSTADGDAVSYMGDSFSEAEGAAVVNSYISRRTTAGWQTIAMSPHLLENRANLAYSGSLDEGMIQQSGNPQLAESAPSGYPNLYLQKAGSPSSLQPVLTEGLFAAHPPHRGAVEMKLEYDGHSADFAAQYFAADDAFTDPTAYAPAAPDPGATGRNLYEWRGGVLVLVNVLPGNATVATDASFVSASPDTNAVSATGRRVYWTAGGHLYVREDNRTTREVHDSGAFLTASPDGLKVLLANGCLYSLATISCADLTDGHGGFRGIVGRSEDLSSIFFIDTAELTPGAEAGSCSQPPNSDKQASKEEDEGKVPSGFGCNLYLYQAGVGTRLIATLAVRDGKGSPYPDDWAAEPGQRTAEASPNGRYLSFSSTARLTGYANVGPCQSNLESSCQEIFLYDSATNRLSCPSCDPSGEAPLGDSTLRRIDTAETHEWLPQPRYLTNQGRLFFDSSNRLSPHDTNGRTEDVYEAEPEGIGSCARSAGCVSLISPGTGSVDSNFLAMDENGENVFFTSREQLVRQDTDGLLDVYDARVGGGFASESEAPECRGEACQPTVSPLTAFGAGTSGFLGAGNVKPEIKPEEIQQKVQRKVQQCSKGKIKQKGKCVIRKAKKHKKRAKKSSSRTVNHKRGGGK